MKKIEDIYNEYKIMPQLREHMFRVAAVASLICSNFTESLEKDNIISACLLHDMGNILKFDLRQTESFLNINIDLEYWQSVKNEYIGKYGDNEHSASLKIAEEIGVSARTLELIRAISFVEAVKNVSSEDYAKKIAEYCDDRVIPFGVVSMEERLMDLRKRYAHKGGDTPERRAFESAVREMEKQIFAKCKIKPEDINNETVKPIISELRNFVIK